MSNLLANIFNKIGEKKQLWEWAAPVISPFYSHVIEAYILDGALGTSIALRNILSENSWNNYMFAVCLSFYTVSFLRLYFVCITILHPQNTPDKYVLNEWLDNLNITYLCLNNIYPYLTIILSLHVTAS